MRIVGGRGGNAKCNARIVKQSCATPSVSNPTERCATHHPLAHDSRLYAEMRDTESPAKRMWRPANSRLKAAGEGTRQLHGGVCRHKTGQRKCCPAFPVGVASGTTSTSPSHVPWAPAAQDGKPRTSGAATRRTRITSAVLTRAGCIATQYALAGVKLGAHAEHSSERSASYVEMKSVCCVQSRSPV